MQKLILSCFNKNRQIRELRLGINWFSVYPTDKMLLVLPEVKAASVEWMTLLSEGIDKTELEVFNSVLMRMQEKAREIIERQDATK